MPEATYGGRCLCGATRYRASGQASNLCYCHCQSCRLASGAPFVAWATFDRTGFQLTQGELTTHRSSKHVVRGFCGACGCTLTYAHERRPAEVDVTLASLEQTADLRPACHIWVSHKLSWVDLADGLPQFPEWRIDGG